MVRRDTKWDAEKGSLDTRERAFWRRCSLSESEDKLISNTLDESLFLCIIWREPASGEANCLLPDAPEINSTSMQSP